MEEIIIDRSKWRCGGYDDNKVGIGHTELENEEGFMCCLGQWISQKYKTIKIKGKDSPKEAVKRNRFLVYKNDCDDYENTFLSKVLMGINDDANITLKKRESKLHEVAKKDGRFKFKFINKPKIKS